MSHAMIDLETFGTRPGCVIRSVGALIFNPKTDDVFETFYVNVDKQSCLDKGLVLDPDTVAWWERQSPAAKAAFDVDPRPLVEVLNSLNAFLRKNAAQQIWSQGSNFDGVLLEACYIACGYRAPWKHWDTRDTRTVYELGGLDTRTVARTGTYHNALDDCRFQARCVQLAYRNIKRV